MKLRFLQCLPLLLILVCSLSASAIDYVRLKKGQVVEGVILRQDTVAVIMTDWTYRHQTQPPLKVYSKDEVESIWFDKPPALVKGIGKYIPHTNGVELGGNFSFQTWVETDQKRRYLGQLGFASGYDIIPELGMQGEASVTLPFGKNGDSWDSYKPAYHVTLDIVVHPFVWKNITPYVFVGGGGALGVPYAGVTLSNSSQIRSLLDTGLGIKWGTNGIGYKVELKHHYYAWTPDAADENGVRSKELAADMTQLKFGLFFYR